jgi:hypothetical protein
MKVLVPRCPQCLEELRILDPPGNRSHADYGQIIYLPALDCYPSTADVISLYPCYGDLCNAKMDEEFYSWT